MSQLLQELIESARLQARTDAAAAEDIGTPANTAQKVHQLKLMESARQKGAWADLAARGLQAQLGRQP